MSSRSSPDKRLSPDLSERLKHSERHYSNRDHHDFHRRRHHRRANKRGRRHRPHSTPEQPQLSKSDHSKSCRPSTSKHLVLRPTKGPLLNAPKNSTQFIIDDHETSPFLDNDSNTESSQSTHNKKYNTRSRQASSSSSSRRVSASDSPQRSPEKSITSSTNSKENQDKDCQATPGNYVVNDDDYTSWAEFSERDFQSVYESAHQEQVADWDRHRLIEEISTLEKRQKELVNTLAKVDPEMYAQRLEAQLEELQEKNRMLRSGLGLNSPEPMNFEESKSPLHSTTQDQSPDSSTKE